MCVYMFFLFLPSI